MSNWSKIVAVCKAKRKQLPEFISMWLQTY